MRTSAERNDVIHGIAQRERHGFKLLLFRFDLGKSQDVVYYSEAVRGAAYPVYIPVLTWIQIECGTRWVMMAFIGVRIHDSCWRNSLFALVTFQVLRASTTSVMLEMENM